MQKSLLFIFIYLWCSDIFGQDSLQILIENKEKYQQENHSKITDVSKISKKNFHLALAGAGITYGAGLYGLHTLWYKNNAQTSFKFFNDNQEWLQMDKIQS